MPQSSFLTPALGAIVGFVLAQAVNLSKLAYEAYRRSKLTIDDEYSNLLLSHTAQVSQQDYAEEKYFGFVVRNTGKTIATGVRFQIIGIGTTDRTGTIFTGILANTALNLSTYRNANNPRGEPEVTLVPGAAVTVGLGWWREDHNTIIPLADNMPDYYDEACQNAYAYHFNVVASNDRGYFVEKVIRISPTQKLTAQPRRSEGTDE